MVSCHLQGKWGFVKLRFGLSQGETLAQLGETAWNHKINNTSAIASLEAARKTRPVTGINFVCFTISAKPKELKGNLLEEAPVCLYREGSYNTVMAHLWGYSYRASWGHAIKDRFTKLLKNLLCLLEFSWCTDKFNSFSSLP